MGGRPSHQAVGPSEQHRTQLKQANMLPSAAGRTFLPEAVVFTSAPWGSKALLSALGPRFQEPMELRSASKMVMEPAGAPVLPPICSAAWSKRESDVETA